MAATPVLLDSAVLPVLALREPAVLAPEPVGPALVVPAPLPYEPEFLAQLLRSRQSFSAAMERISPLPEKPTYAPAPRSR